MQEEPCPPIIVVVVAGGRQEPAYSFLLVKRTSVENVYWGCLTYHSLKQQLKSGTTDCYGLTGKVPQPHPAKRPRHRDFQICLAGMLQNTEGIVQSIHQGFK